ncbi:MAG: hypothetical protein HRU39_17355 [Salinicola sp.]|nr:hypothetical protein [Salinicola sp.]
MKRDIRSIPLELIKLDQENVRFGGDVAQNQREAIELLMADPNDAKKLLRLTEHISLNGLDPTELQLVTPQGIDGEFIVLEGNRRLTALKLLQKPDLCPDESLIKSFLAIRAKMEDEAPREIECSVVASREDGDVWLEIKHTGENGGVGRVGWDPDIRDERRARQTGVESVGRQIRKLMEQHAFLFEDKALHDVRHIHVTTLTRLFSSKPAQETLGLKLENKVIIPQYEMRLISPSLSFVVSMFVDHGYNVNDVRANEDRKKFLSHIPPELLPKTIFLSLDNSAASGYAPPMEPNSQPGGALGAGSNPEVSQGNADADSGQDQKASNDGKIKTRAKPSSNARKYLVPWSLNISNGRINEIYRELRSKLEVEKVVNATAITFRVFLELTCDDFRKSLENQGVALLRADNAKPLAADANLAVKICAVNQYLLNEGLISAGQGKTIAKRASSKDTIGSVDHLNQFVHDVTTSPLASELKGVADEYRPLLESVWR